MPDLVSVEICPGRDDDTGQSVFVVLATYADGSEVVMYAEPDYDWAVDAARELAGTTVPVLDVVKGNKPQ